MVKLKLTHCKQCFHSALSATLFCGWLSASDDLKVTNDTQSIQIIKSTVSINGDSKKVELELKNAGNSPLLGVTYLTNKDLLLATHGYGTEIAYTESYLPKDRIAPGKDFKATISGDLEMVQVTIAGAVFKKGDEGDPLLAERIRADFEGMAVRARQVLSLLQTPGPGPLTNDEVAKLEAKIKALSDVQPSKKLSARGRQAFLYGQQTQREFAMQSIAELKSEMKRWWLATEGLDDSERYLDKDQKYKDLRKYHAEVAEVLQ
jgi:hypothetical protein